MAEKGYFAKGSAVRRVWGEVAVVPAGVPRMLLIEAAHPLVAAAISGHSAFRKNPWKRLAATVEAYSALIFGTRAQADRAGGRIRVRHAAVRGEIDQRMGRYAAGTTYAATDPQLLLWVHAACVDTGLVMYETFVRRLAESTRDQFYEEMKAVASFLGIPDSTIPPTLSDFYADLNRRMANEICMTTAAEEIAALVLDPPVPAPLRALRATVRAVTIAMLPAQIRASYGLSCGPGARLIVAASAHSMRRVLMPLVSPGLLWGETFARAPQRVTLEVVAALARTKA